MLREREREREREEREFCVYSIKKQFTPKRSKAIKRLATIQTAGNNTRKLQAQN